MQFQEFVNLLTTSEVLNYIEYKKIILLNSRNWGIMKTFIAYTHLYLLKYKITKIEEKHKYGLNYIKFKIEKKLKKTTKEDKKFIEDKNSIKFLLSHPTSDFLCNYVLQRNLNINDDNAILNYIKKNPFNKYIQYKYIQNYEEKFNLYKKFNLNKSYGEYYEYESLNMIFLLLKLKDNNELHLSFYLKDTQITSEMYEYKLLNRIMRLNANSNQDYCNNCYYNNGECICCKRCYNYKNILTFNCLCNAYESKQIHYDECNDYVEYINYDYDCMDLYDFNEGDYKEYDLDSDSDYYY